MAPRNEVDVAKNVEQYLGPPDVDSRYRSFDFCFNYFQQRFDEDRGRSLASPSHLKESCLQLGFYLASWGMYRGSSKLLRHSVHHLVPVVEEIARTDDDVWTIDVEDYNTSVDALLIETGVKLRRAFGGATDTLVTKVRGIHSSGPDFGTATL